MSLGDPRVVRVSARPPPKFSATADFALWIQRFEIYLSEAEIPAEKRARELVSLLDDGPFRVITQLGLVNSNEYGYLKEQLQRHYAPIGDDLEWQHRLQNRCQKPGEPLSEFVGELRMLADKAYPDWEPKQRLEMARNQFIQGVASASIQLVLMREKPKTVEEALEIAQRQLAVETAQKRLHRRLPEQHVHSLETQTEVKVEANALQRSEATAGSMQLEELSRQVQRLSAELARLRTDSERRENPHERSKPTRRAPVCWNCNERGHLRKDCPRRRPFNRTSQPHATYSTSSMATEAAVFVEGLIGTRPTKMLVDTGSAVTILREDVWKETVDGQHLEPPLSPVVAANGEKLDVCGRSSVSLQVGGICTCYPVLVVRNVTQECLLGANFLENFGCTINLRERTLSVEGTSVPLQLKNTRLLSTCHVSCAETTVVPGCHQMELPIQLRQSRIIGEFEGILEPEMKFMERRGVLIARSIHSVSAGSGRSLVRVLNPSSAPITVYRDEKLGVLQPLSRPLESAALEEADPSSQSKEVEKAVIQLQSKAQGLSEAESIALETLMFNFSDVISLNNSDLGRTNVVRHKIDTQGATPIRQPPRRLPFHQRELVKRLLDDMLERKIVEPATGPWSSPIVLVPKKMVHHAFVWTIVG